MFTVVITDTDVKTGPGLDVPTSILNVTSITFKPNLVVSITGDVNIDIELADDTTVDYDDATKTWTFA